MNDASGLPRDARALDTALSAFPAAIQPLLDGIRRHGGWLSAEEGRTIAERMHLDPDELMVRLLPLATCFAAPTISGFYVGAVARGRVDPVTGWGSIYFGANIEFRGEALSAVVHAEQSAVNHAWLRGESRLSGLAVTAAPCGYCRQFLNELAGAADLSIFLPDETGLKHSTWSLRDLLPSAFGPADLGRQGGLMDVATGGGHALEFVQSTQDPVAVEALAAATHSYAPYTGGFAGCAVQADDGRVYAGRYAENAAYSPSLAPLQSAIALMHATRCLAASARLRRAVLVEVPSFAGLRRATQAVLASVAPHLELEYLEARSAARP